LLNAGTDTVQSSVTFTLADNVENLTLTGTTINGTGNALANVLVGNSYANTLTGGDGADILSGGFGKDTLTGNAEADTFKFNYATESAIDTNRDVVTDFLSSQGDKIDLSVIDAIPATAGDQAFNFIGTQAFGADATGQLRFEGGVVFGSTDADSLAEFSIALTGVASVSSGDFIL